MKSDEGGYDSRSPLGRAPRALSSLHRSEAPGGQSPLIPLVTAPLTDGRGARIVRKRRVGKGAGGSTQSSLLSLLSSHANFAKILNCPKIPLAAVCGMG